MSIAIRFCRFWYDFIVGDDWTIAVVVALAVSLTFAAAHLGVTAWWILPCAVAGTLGVSVLRARRPNS
jgi:uncharacterized membrane protein YczE